MNRCHSYSNRVGQRIGALTMKPHCCVCHRLPESPLNLDYSDRVTSPRGDYFVSLDEILDLSAPELFYAGIE